MRNNSLIKHNNMKAEDYFEEQKPNMRELWHIGKVREEMICLLMERYATLHKTNVSGWVAVTEKLPNHLQTVFISNGKGYTTLGCRVVTEDGWFWAETNGVIYESNGEIVSECEIQDLDVVFWHELPKPPCV